MQSKLNILKSDAINLLKNLISIESFSRNEKGTGDLIEQFFANSVIPGDSWYCRLHELD